MSEFQAASVWQGAHFDAQCRFVLRSMGFGVSDKPFVMQSIGIEVDAWVGGESLAYNNKFWCEFKGSYQGDRPGLRRADTLKKAIASGALLSMLRTCGSAIVIPPFVVVTSHLPATWSAGEAMLSAARDGGFIADVLAINDPDDVRRFAERWS